MRLHHRVTGSGPPLIIIHGLFGSSTNWTGIGRRLAGMFQVFALDMRNHGDSPDADRMSYDDMSEDVLEFVESHGIDRAHLVGHSMGGKVAMRVAQRSPERVRKLVVVDIAPKRYKGGHEALLDALLELEPGSFKTRGEIDVALAGVIPDRTVRQFFLTSIGRDDAGRLAWKIKLRAIRANYDSLNEATPGAPLVQKETLFLLGGRSRHVGVQDELSILQIFPKAQFSVVGGADHWVHADAPERFCQVVQTFLAG